VGGYGARAGFAKTVTHGLVSWGVLACLAAGILVIRLHFAEASRAPLPPLPGVLSAAQQRSWRSFPDYHGVVPVLNYHSVGGRASYLTVSRVAFAQQMRALKLGGFHTLTIGQYAAYVRSKHARLPSRPILLTFDDGRLDAYRAADTILRMYGFHAIELVVPGWVSAHPNFSLSWREIQRMSRSGRWDVQAHFGYGGEQVLASPKGNYGAAFANLEYTPGTAGHPGHYETFAHFKKRVTGNMLWAVRKMREEIPGYRSIAMAIPESDYGQQQTNYQPIPRFVLPWLDSHFTVVFGGDYLDTAQHHPLQIKRRFSRFPELSYRIAMGPQESLPVLHCRLLDFVHQVQRQNEYHCLQQGSPVPSPGG
jgi:polysaccharide deacetylase